jgi:hypothetical protein
MDREALLEQQVLRAPALKGASWMRNMMRPDTAQLWKITRCCSRSVGLGFASPPTRKVRPSAPPFVLVDMSDRLELVRNAVSFLTDPKVIYASLSITVSSHRLV